MLQSKAALCMIVKLEPQVPNEGFHKGGAKQTHIYHGPHYEDSQHGALKSWKQADQHLLSSARMEDDEGCLN